MTQALDRSPSFPAGLPTGSLLAEFRVRGGSAGLALPPTEALLAEGGDMRLALDPVSGCNRYGCTPRPGAGMAHFSSATASTVSPEGFLAADRLRQRLMEMEGAQSRAATYARELDRIRVELVELCGLGGVAGLDVVFAPSGTDLHLLAAEMFAGTASAPTLCIDVEPEETGSGVPAALNGRHFSGWTALGAPVTAGGSVGAGGTEFAALAAREADGSLRATAEIEAELDSLAYAASKAGRKVLLVVSDVSKTGLISPGLEVVLALRRRFPRSVEVLIDACQFRLSPASLRAYLDLGFLVAVTGSKFLGGPTFSAALLVPASAGEDLRGRLPRPGLRPYSARAEWPADWVARAALTDVANFGLLLRWEAALAEFRAFRAVPEAQVEAFVARFADAVQAKLASDPAFEPLPGRAPDRTAIGVGQGWDRLPTIFPFLLRLSVPAHDGYLRLAAAQDVYRFADGRQIPGSAGPASALRATIWPPDQCASALQQRAPDRGGRIQRRGRSFGRDRPGAVGAGRGGRRGPRRFKFRAGLAVGDAQAPRAVASSVFNTCAPTMMPATRPGAWVSTVSA